MSQARVVLRSRIGPLVVALFTSSLAFLIIPLVVWAQAPAMTALRFGAVVNPGEPVVTDAVVTVLGDSIVAVGSGTDQIPRGAWVIDLRPLTAIPGMIDVHTHLGFVRDRDAGLVTAANRSRDTVMVMVTESARSTLRSGVTTVRDLNDIRGVAVAMRDAINQGLMVGPRMFVSGAGLVADDSTRADLPKAIRQRVLGGADWIKMFASTGSASDVSGNQTFTDAEVRLAVTTAHAYGKRIAVHSYGVAGASAALSAGAESIEHPAGLSDDLLAEWARSGTYYVPTVDHNRFYIDNAEALGFRSSVPQLDSFRVLNLETVTRAHRAGVKLAMGSDAVFWMYGENTRELGWFVRAGLSNEEALATATINGAALLGMAHKLGRIAPGFYADIVGVEGNPLQDINVVINGVDWVMKGGHVVIERDSR